MKAPMRRIRSGCCAPATSGHATAARPSWAINSRRLTSGINIRCHEHSFPSTFRRRLCRLRGMPPFSSQKVESTLCPRASNRRRTRSRLSSRKGPANAMALRFARMSFARRRGEGSPNIGMNKLLYKYVRRAPVMPASLAIVSRLSEPMNRVCNSSKLSRHFRRRLSNRLRARSDAARRARRAFLPTLACSPALRERRHCGRTRRFVAVCRARRGLERGMGKALTAALWAAQMQAPRRAHTPSTRP